jgi:microcystin synthetase protein McyG
MAVPTELGESTSLVKQALLAVEQMRAKLAAAERRGREPIAIVGAACRFPGEANDPDAFWQRLRNGVNTVGRIPDERWDVAAYYDPNPDTPGKSYAAHGAFIKDIDLFDAAFFNIAPVEAMTMDPQQRLLLELSWQALEHGAIAPDSLRGEQVGVFVGICSSDYSLYTLASRQVAQIDAFRRNRHRGQRGRRSPFLFLRLSRPQFSGRYGLFFVAAGVSPGLPEFTPAGM